MRGEGFFYIPTSLVLDGNICQEVRLPSDERHVNTCNEGEFRMADHRIEAKGGVE